VLYYNNWLYIIFGVYFFFLIFAAVFNLINKYRISESIFKKQILLLTLSIIIGLSVGSYVDLIICYFGNFKHVWAGPPFTLLMNFVVFYLIFNKKEQ
jgi:hypothetical protein